MICTAIQMKSARINTMRKQYENHFATQSMGRLIDIMHACICNCIHENVLVCNLYKTKMKETAFNDFNSLCQSPLK